MNREFPVPGRLLFLLRSGSVSYDEVQQIVVKSLRSKLMLLAVWIPAHISSFLRGGSQHISLVLTELGVLSLDEEVTGFFAYTPRDFRRRSYGVVRTSQRSLFLKIGSDIKDEGLPEAVFNGLERTKFTAHLPLSRHKIGNIYVNVYKYLSISHVKKVRMSHVQARDFSVSLNADNIFVSKKLSEFMLSSNINAEAVETMNTTIVQDILEYLKNIPLKMGVVHGDLMNPNIFRRYSPNQEFVILDWESYSNNAPVILDQVGALNWSTVKLMAEKAILEKINNLKAVDSTQTQALIFMLIAGSRGFTPAILWLNGLSAMKEFS